MRALPGTLCTIVLLVAAACRTGSWRAPLAVELLDRYGCSPADLREPPQWWRRGTSAVLTGGGAAF